MARARVVVTNGAICGMMAAAFAFTVLTDWADWVGAASHGGVAGKETVCDPLIDLAIMGMVETEMPFAFCLLSWSKVVISCGIEGQERWRVHDGGGISGLAEAEETRKARSCA